MWSRTEPFPAEIIPQLKFQAKNIAAFVSLPSGADLALPQCLYYHEKGCPSFAHFAKLGTTDHAPMFIHHRQDPEPCATPCQCPTNFTVITEPAIYTSSPPVRKIA
jgi:hypothetical protein